MKSTARGGIRAAGITLTAALIALGASGGPALADPAEGGGPQGRATPAVNLINQDSGSLTIHKYTHPGGEIGDPGSGLEIDPFAPPTGALPLEGVVFTAEQIDPATYDLKTNAGWSAVAGLTPQKIANDQIPLEAPVSSAETNSEGWAKIANLPVGAYLITETEYPSGTTPLPPFIVTVPVTDPGTAATPDTPGTPAKWVYDVHVYPKNPQTNASKTVSDADSAKKGDAVVWTILGDIPETNTVAEGAKIDGYRIVDVLDSRLTYGTYVPGETPSVDDTDATTVSLTTDPETVLSAGVDYTLSVEADDTDSKATKVQVTFTPAGLEKLEQNTDRQVKVVITTFVNASGDDVTDPTASGIISNQASIYPNAAAIEGEVEPVTTEKVVTKWGNVSILKQDAEEQTALPGATFAIYATKDDAENDQRRIDTQKTGDDGLAHFTVLRYSGWADGAETTAKQTYWIAEIAAPDGYSLNATPVEVEVDDADAKYDVTMDNAKKFVLPKTGGAGTLALTAAGALLISAAVLQVIRRRRRETVES
ncbi:SpaH/EbpB family LPXTG-anchored major pilin [Xylanimonas ulmi]|uniref:LPXTG-motif cell wall-anchored protein n=1 Tax=Xylanimonas ulmi TaxID=228973 RepID=A0A4Q7LZQ6_9MICO|nr:SpaH/EbpB family LPXTG-anchored major pilin [Xylanibacterium ulmi]RZS60301.1 LPXTG-motif cell wall-anchored protein [Xylanibacterium ulmi]